MTQSGDDIRLEKIGAVDDPAYPTPDEDEYEPGQYHPGVSVPKGYTVKGTLMDDLREGDMLLLDRTHRNGEEIRGVMSTSSIQQLRDHDTHVIITTQSSIYRLTRTDQP